MQIAGVKSISTKVTSDFLLSLLNTLTRIFFFPFMNWVPLRRAVILQASDFLAWVAILPQKCAAWDWALQVIYGTLTAGLAHKHDLFPVCAREGSFPFHGLADPEHCSLTVTRRLLLTAVAPSALDVLALSVKLSVANDRWFSCVQQSSLKSKFHFQPDQASFRCWSHR